MQMAEIMIISKMANADMPAGNIKITKANIISVSPEYHILEK